MGRAAAGAMARSSPAFCKRRQGASPDCPDAARRDRSGERGGPQPGGAGNTFSITISPEGAVIRNAVVEDAVPERYSLAELRAALETWIAALERAHRSTGPPVP
jgi:hypothetical protein